MRLPRWVAAVGIVGGLAGCGTAGKTVVPTTTTLLVTTTTLSPEEQAKARAKKIVLQASDMQSYTVAKPDTSTNDEASAFDECDKLAPQNAALDDDPRSVDSESFERSDGAVTVDSSAIVLGDASRAKAVGDELALPALHACVQRAFAADLTKESGKGAVSQVKVGPVGDLTGTGAEQTTAVRLSALLKTPQGQVPIVVFVVVVRKADVVAQLEYGGPAVVLEENELRRLTNLLASRL